MKDSSVDRVKGVAHEIKGAAKEKVGQATGDPQGML